MKHLRPPLRAALLLALAFVLAPAGVEAAEDSRVAELERQVAELRAEVARLREAPAGDGSRIAEIERRIEVLAREIESLRLGEAPPAATEGRHGLAPAASKVYRVERGVAIGGYGEMLYENFDSETESGTPSGKRDQLDFLRAIVYFGYKFNDRIVFNSEIEFEHASSGKNGEVSVEFAYLDFLIRDEVNVRAGMVLVPMGFVNELHEPPIFLGARRPYVEQTILPTTWRENGAGIFGEAGPVSYRAYVVTGLTAFPGTASNASGFSQSGIRNGRSSGSRSAAEDFALVGRLDWAPIEMLTLGASAYKGGADQGVKDPSGLPIDADVTILEGHAELRWRGLQARALYARTKIDDVPRINAALTAADPTFAGKSIGERQYGWFAEVGYDVLLAGGRTRHALIPYLRYERYDTQDRVPVGFTPRASDDVKVTTVGAAWKPILNVVVKADWNRIENAGGTGVDQINAAVGYLF